MKLTNCNKCCCLVTKIEELKKDLTAVTDQLQQTQFNSARLQIEAKELAVDKKKLASALYKCQKQNSELVQQNQRNQTEFHEKNEKMWLEINSIRKAMTKMNKTNEKLQLKLTKTNKTTVQLSIMFLRMKETKQNIEKNELMYKTLNRDFSYLIREQADLIKKGANSRENDKHFIYRVSDLLCENADLRFKLAKAETSTSTPENQYKNYLKLCPSRNKESSEIRNQKSTSEIVIFDRLQYIQRNRSNSM